MDLNDSLSAVCDVTGNFKITIDNKSTVLKASSVGFKSLRIKYFN